MKHLRALAFLAAAALAPAGCGDLKQSLTTSDRAAREFQDRDTDLLCGRFSDDMKQAMPCDSLDRIIRQTDDLLGAPTGKCRWNFTYRIVSTDPFRTVAVYKCPHEKEGLKLQVTVDVIDGTGYVSGLFGDSPLIRKSPVLTRVRLAKSVNDDTNKVTEAVDRGDWNWPKIFLWTQWQNVAQGAELSMKWIAPDGDSVGEFPFTVPNGPNQTYYYWTFINPANLPVKEPAGTWTVKIMINGKEVEDYRFEMDYQAP